MSNYLGNHFRQSREKLGLTQDEMSRVLGYVSQSKISDIERGVRRPSQAVSLLLQAYLDGYRPVQWPK